MKYPWDTMPKGSGFFVPSLDPYRTMREGVTDALRHRGRFKAQVVVLSGMLGVLFVRQ